MVTAAGLVLLAYLLARVEHLFASAVWVWARGSGWITAVKANKTDPDDPIAIANSFARHGGGKLPFLYFGVKSYRMGRWVQVLKDSGRTRRSLALKGIRTIFWQYGVVLLWIAPLIVFLGRIPLEGLARWGVVLCAFVLLFGLAAICIELWVAGLQMGSWTSYYHRSRLVPYDDPNQREKGLEHMFAVVVTLYTCLLSTIPVQFVTRVQFPLKGQSNPANLPQNLLDAIVQVVIDPFLVFGYISGDGKFTLYVDGNPARTLANFGCFMAWIAVVTAFFSFKGEISDRT